MIKSIKFYFASLCLLLGIIFFAPQAAFSQNYSFQTSTGNAIVPETTDTGNYCDECNTAITLPFTYTFYGETYTIRLT
jgi:hypothetical protein